MNRFVCFYTSKQFWTGEKPIIDINKVSKDNMLFTKKLSEIIYNFNNEFLNLSFCKDGLIMAQIHELDSKRIVEDVPTMESVANNIKLSSDYISYLNAIQLVFISSYLKHEKLDYFKNDIIRNDEVVRVELVNDEFTGGSIPQRYAKHFFNSRFIHNNISFTLLRDYRVEIPEIVFEDCFQNLTLIIDNTEAIQMLSDFNSAVSEYKNMNFRQSLIQAWFIIEYYINKKWNSYIEEKQCIISGNDKRINSKRRNALLGNGFTSFVTSNVLELNGFIPFEIFQKIDSVRKIRNTFVHSIDLKSSFVDSSDEKSSNNIASEGCKDSFIVIQYFIKEEYNLDIEISEGFGLSVL